jgi:SAM-dependent methyltransferase
MDVKVVPPPESAAEVRERHESNRQGWNEGAAHYTRAFDDTLAFLRAGKSNLMPLERSLLGRLDRFDRAIHLQCASGKDTLSLWNEGVKEVVGLDISDVHIDNARRLTALLSAPATWHRCDVLEPPAELNASADLVYTGRGALCWLLELERWGEVVARLLKPGGTFFVLDDHPLSILFDPDASTFVYSGFDYFRHSDAVRGWPSSYIDEKKPDAEQAVKYTRAWSLADVFQVLVRAGLEVTHLGEHPEPYWRAFPAIDPAVRQKLPMSFTLMARRRG